MISRIITATWKHLDDIMRRQLLLYLTVVAFVGLLIFIIFSNTNIEHYFINQNVDQLRCEVFLGILTVQAHTSLRKFIRNSWIKDLPRNVCYKFLYDIPEYIPILEKFDGVHERNKQSRFANIATK